MSMNLRKSKSKQLYLKGMCYVAYANLEELKDEKMKSKIQILKENTDRSHFPSSKIILVCVFEDNYLHVQLFHH